MRWYRSDSLDLLAVPETPFRSEELRELVDKLPPRERYVIERLYFGGATTEAIAQEQGVSLSTIRNLKAKGLRRLSEQVSSQNPIR